MQAVDSVSHSSGCLVGFLYAAEFFQLSEKKKNTYTCSLRSVIFYILLQHSIASSQSWGCIPIIPVIKRLRHKDPEFEASLGQIKKRNEEKKEIFT